MVVGGYVRYEEPVRNALKDARLKVASAFELQSKKRENYLIWGPPGCGKTYFTQQIAASLPDVSYLELNLAKYDKEKFISALDEPDNSSGPHLCFVDEIDAKSNEAWPYETLLPYMDLAVNRDARLVFMLAGSSGSSIIELKERIASRPKGADLLSRIPSVNEYGIPPMTIGDRTILVLNQFRQAGKETGKNISTAEKLAVYYLVVNPILATARQLREFVVRTVDRIPSGEDRVKYDHLFDPGDPENKTFWMQVRPIADELAEKFVAVED